MVTTGIWKIEKRLDHVIKYTINVNKDFKVKIRKIKRKK